MALSPAMSKSAGLEVVQARQDIRAKRAWRRSCAVRHV